MSLPTPTTQGLSEEIIAQLEGSLAQTFPLLPKAFLRVLAKVLAGVVILLYKYVGFGWLQQFVQHASWRETVVGGQTIRPLVELGRMLGAGDPIDATRAELTVQITVLNQSGSLAANAQLVRPQSGVIYLSLAPVVLDAPTKEVLIRAYSDPAGNGGAGIVGNLVVGDTLEFANAQGNIAQQAIVTSVAVVGAEGETETAYRSRVFRRKRRPPQGGAYADYSIWGELVAGVANIYPQTGLPGEVSVYVECTPDLDADGIPNSTLLDAVDAAIQLNDAGLASRRPAGALARAFPITRRGFDFVVSGLIDPVSSTEARDEIETGVDEYLRSLEPYVVGLSVPPRRDRVTQGAVAGVVHEIVSARGGEVSNLQLYNDSQLITAYTLEPGEKARLGAIAYE